MAIIRVSGHLGAGKTTICEMLSLALGYENHYTGDVFNQMAKEKGMSKEDFYKEMELYPDLEKEIDSRQEQLMISGKNLIVQGRIAPFLKYNPKETILNIFFRVSESVGARRQLNRSENKHRTFAEMLFISRERMAEEKRRYRKLYPHIVDYFDESYFDIIIDTTNKTESQVYIETLTFIRRRI